MISLKEILCLAKGGHLCGCRFIPDDRSKVPVQVSVGGSVYFDHANKSNGGPILVEYLTEQELKEMDENNNYYSPETYDEWRNSEESV